MPNKLTQIERNDELLRLLNNDSVSYTHLTLPTKA